MADKQQNPEKDGAVQQAQIDEAAGDETTEVKFDGHVYTVATPSAKVLEYLAEWQVNDQNLALVLAVKALVGQRQWDEWCSRNEADQLGPFFIAIEEAQAPS